MHAKTSTMVAMILAGTHAQAAVIGNRALSGGQALTGSMALASDQALTADEAVTDSMADSRLKARTDEVGARALAAEQVMSAMNAALEANSMEALTVDEMMSVLRATRSMQAPVVARSLATDSDTITTAGVTKPVSDTADGLVDSVDSSTGNLDLDARDSFTDCVDNGVPPRVCALQSGKRAVTKPVVDSATSSLGLDARDSFTDCVDNGVPPRVCALQSGKRAVTKPVTDTLDSLTGGAAKPVSEAVEGVMADVQGGAS